MRIINKKILKETLEKIDINNDSPEIVRRKIEPFYKESKKVLVKPGNQTIENKLAAHTQDFEELEGIDTDPETVTFDILSSFVEKSDDTSYDELQDFIFMIIIKDILRDEKSSPYSIFKSILETPFNEVIYDRDKLNILISNYNDFIDTTSNLGELQQYVGDAIADTINEMMKHPENFPPDPEVEQSDEGSSQYSDDVYEPYTPEELTNPPQEIKDKDVLNKISGYKRVVDENHVTGKGDFWIKKKRNGAFVVFQALPDSNGKLKGVNITAEVNQKKNTSVDKLFDGAPLEETSAEREQQISLLLKSLEDYLLNPEEYVAVSDRESIGMSLKLRVASYATGSPIRNKDGQEMTPLPALDLAEYWYNECWGQTNKNITKDDGHLLGNRYMIESYYIERIAKIGNAPERIKALNTELTNSNSDTYTKVKTSVFSKICTDEYPGIWGRVKPKLQDFYYKYTSTDGTNKHNDPSKDRILHNRDQIVDGMSVTSEYSDGRNKFWFVWSLNLNNSVDTVNLRLKRVYFNNISLPKEKVQAYAEEFGDPYKPKVEEIFSGGFWIGEYNPKSHMVENLLKEDLGKDKLGTLYSFDDICEIINSASDPVKLRKISVVNNAIRALGRGDYVNDVIIVKLKDESKKPSLFDYNDMRQFNGFIEYDFTVENKVVPVMESYLGNDLFIFLKDGQSYNTYKQIVGVE